MKKHLHPVSRPVVFQDLSTGDQFLIASTIAADETTTYEGATYPLVKVHISRASHPYYTGDQRLVDVEGRVDKFRARQEAAQKAAEAAKSRQGKKTKSSAKPAASKIGTLAHPAPASAKAESKNSSTSNK